MNKLSNLQQRLIISGISLIFLLIAIAFSYSPYFRPFFSLIGAGIFSAAVWEFYFIGKAKGYNPLDSLGIVGTAAYTLAVFLSTQAHSALYLPEIVIGAIAAIAFLYFFVKGKDPFINLSITFFAFLYLTIPLSSIIKINYFFPLSSLQDGRWWLVYLLAVTKMTDTGAYFSGKRWGKKLLAPIISPKKTREGAAGGLIAGIGASFLIWKLAAYFQPHSLSLSFFEVLVLGAALSVAGQFGDLAESLLKRDGGMKDSNQLPGLGGMLDIVDSLIFTSPLLLLYLKIMF